jgi:hypothetical protein
MKNIMLKLALCLALISLGDGAALAQPGDLSIEGYPARQIDKMNGSTVYFVDMYTPQSGAGNHPSAAESAKKIGEALLQSGVLNAAEEGSNIYITFTGLTAVHEDADSCTFAVAQGSEFPRQDYANLDYLAVDSGGNIYSQNSDSYEWETWEVPK